MSKFPDPEAWRVDSSGCPIPQRPSGLLEGRAAVLRLKTIANHVAASQEPAVIAEEPATLRGLDDLPGPRSTNTRAYDAGVHRYLNSLHLKFGDIFKVLHSGQLLVVVRDKERVTTLLTSDKFVKCGTKGLSSNKVNYVMNLIQPMMPTQTPFNFRDHLEHQEQAAHEELRSFFLRPEVFQTEWETQALNVIETIQAGDMDVQRLCFILFERLVITILAGDQVQQACDAAGSAFRLTFEYFVQRYTTGGSSYTVSPADEMAMDKLEAAAERVVSAVFSAENSKTPSLLFEMKAKDIPQDVIIATVVNLISTAVEAPASAMARTLQELAFNRSLQEDMRHASGEHLQDMTLEALRRFAPATLVMREAVADVVLGDVMLPKGTIVGICIPAVHACPAHFSQPEAFLSDRGLDFNPDKMFLTFSGGKRACLGRYFAVEMLQIGMSMLVKRFQLLPVEEYRKNSDFPKFMEWSTEGIRLKLVVRAPRD